MSNKFIVALTVHVVVKAANAVIAEQKAFTHAEDYLRGSHHVTAAQFIRAAPDGPEEAR